MNGTPLVVYATLRGWTPAHVRATLQGSFLPVSEYPETAEDRGEGGRRLDVEECARWLEKYEGHAGLRRAFARLL